MANQSKTATLYPSSISQPNMNQQHFIKKWSFLEVRRGGSKYNLGGANPNDPRFYHGWTNINELKTGGKAQCGRPSTYHCSHATYYGIKGYRNTCPIAGCNGTYNTPATLQLKLSGSALNKKNITADSKIENVTITFKHRCTGVDVGNGRETDGWGPNFYGYDTYPNLKVLKIYITNSKDKRVSKIVTTNSNGKDFDNPPLELDSKKAGTVSATFKNVSYNDLKNGAINIEYGRNLSTNPGNIYISGVKLSIKYSNAESIIKIGEHEKFLYTSQNEACRTSLTQTVLVGYQNKGKMIPYSQMPSNFTHNDIKVKAPKNVTVEYLYQENEKIVYKITDKSGVEGIKDIDYKFKKESKSVTIPFEAIKKTKPSISLSSKIKYDLSAEEIDTQLIIKDGCCQNIKIYADDFEHPISELTSNAFDYEKSNNILLENHLKNTVQNISKLSCGLHTIIFVRDDESTDDMILLPTEIVSREYAFKFSANCAGQDTTYTKGINQNSFKFLQNKHTPLERIYIERIDNEHPNTTPQFLITANTLDSNKKVTNNMASIPITIPNGSEKTYDISKYSPGEFYIAIEESNDFCHVFKDIRNIHIEPYHKQNHDFIYIRGEDSTSFDYNYIVGWEGDEIRQPIDVEDIELICQYDDIKICAHELYTTGISRKGIAQIKVTNQSPYQKDFKNIKIELNVLRRNEDGALEVSTDDFFERDGMLLNFVENFNIVNEDMLSNLSVVNLTEDLDYEDEENIYIQIKELKYDTTILINIPFMCRTDKEIFIQPLILGNPMKVYRFNGCNGSPLDYIRLQTYDSILTDIKIIGELDYLEPNITNNYLTGASENQCPNECFVTKNNPNLSWDADDGGITYRIQNIDSNTVVEAPTIIHNDENLIPFGFIYYKGGNKYTKIIDDSYIPDTGDKVYWKSTEETRKVDLINGIINVYVNFPNTEEQLFIKRTDSNGNIKVFITIPSYSSKSYTISTLLSEVLCLYYEGNDINKHSWNGKLNSTVTSILSKKQTETQKRINDLKEARAKLNSSTTQYKNLSDAIDVLENNTKNNVSLNVIDNYRKYKPGDIVELNIHAESELHFMDNNIIFNSDIQNPGDIDTLTVFYKVCNLENNIGILNTEFQTNSKTLIPNKINKNIYFGVDTQLTSKVSIEKRIVEQNTLNVLHVYLFNKIRDNKDIRCIIDLGIYPNEKLLGSYDFINIEIDDGDYNLISNQEQYTDTNNNSIDYQHLFIEWNIGEMQADTQTKAIIILKGNNIGLSEILVDTYDYLHDGSSKTYHFGEYLCNCREE